MIVEHFPVGMLQCNCTIVGDEASGEAIVVDGGDDVDEIVARLEHHQLRAKYLVHTHAHFDHIGALGDLRDRAGGQGMLHPADLPLYRMLEQQARWVGLVAKPPRVVTLDGDLHDGDVLRAGHVTLTAHHTPGHTPGSTSFSLETPDEVRLLTGDTLFRSGIGRWDLGGTSLEDIVQSIRQKLLVFADDAIVIPGHGPASTIGVERASNPYLVQR